MFEGRYRVTYVVVIAGLLHTVRGLPAVATTTTTIVLSYLSYVREGLSHLSDWVPLAPPPSSRA